MNHHFGNLLTDIEDSDRAVIVQQVNCQGVMASGFAKDLRAKWPIVYTKYRAKYDDRNLAHGADLLGQVQLMRVVGNVWVANIFGQQYYGRDDRRYTSYDALDDGFQTLAWMLPGHGFTAADVHHPLIGCGLGGADWGVVASIIEVRLGDQTTLWTLPSV